MSGFQVTVETEIDRDWDRAMGSVGGGLRIAVHKACEAGAEEARTKHKYKDRTHKLTDSTKGYVTGWTATSAEGVIEATAKHASFVEKGTKPHRIEPKRKKVLRWEGSGGTVFFSHGVNHPGTQPAGGMGMGFLKAERVLEAQLDVAAEAAQKALT